MMLLLALLNLAFAAHAGAPETACRATDLELHAYHRAATAEEKQKIVAEVARRNNVTSDIAESYLKHGKPLPPVDVVADQNVSYLMRHMTSGQVIGRQVSGAHTPDALNQLVDRGLIKVVNLTNQRVLAIKLPDGTIGKMYSYQATVQAEGGRALTKSVFSRHQLKIVPGTRRLTTSPTAFSSAEEFDGAMKAIMSDVRARAEERALKAGKPPGPDPMRIYSNGIPFECYWDWKIMPSGEKRVWIKTIMSAQVAY